MPTTIGQMNHAPVRSVALPPESTPIVVNTPALLDQMVAHLRRQPSLALDTESDSFHAYYPKVCLIQITTFADLLHPESADAVSLDEAGASADPVVDYLVDPLALQDLGVLGAHLASGVEVVMHAAENDILLLQRDFGMKIARVFDTQMAARVLGWEHVGLGPLLENTLGVVSDKRMQRTDWGRRPLSAEQIAYAQMDTHYLFTLQELLTAALHDAGRWEEARAAFGQLALLDAGEYPVAERTFWSMRAAHRAPLGDLALLELLWEWREHEAQRQNRPPFKVMGDDLLLVLAHRRPATMNELRAIHGVTPEQVRRYGTEIRAAIVAAEGRPQPPLPKPTIRPELLLSPADAALYERLRKWRSDRASGRGVAPEIVFNNETLLNFVAQRPDSIDALAAMRLVGAWKAQAYGEEVLALLNGKRPS